MEELKARENKVENNQEEAKQSNLVVRKLNSIVKWKFVVLQFLNKMHSLEFNNVFSAPLKLSYQSQKHSQFFFTLNAIKICVTISYCQISVKIFLFRLSLDSSEAAAAARKELLASLFKKFVFKFLSLYCQSHACSAKKFLHIVKINSTQK